MSINNMFWVKFTTFILSLSLLAIVIACQSRENIKPESPVEKLRAKLSDHAIEIILSPETAYVFEVTPDFTHPEGYILSSPKRTLNSGQVSLLKDLLLSDNSYIFDRTKSCLFIPTYGYLFAKGEAQVLILVSPSCKQIKMQYQEEESAYLDNDPSFISMEIFYKTVK